MPGTSVFSPSPPSGPSSTVLAPPTARTSSLDRSSSVSTAAFSGIVSESPAHEPSSPSRKPASPAASTSYAS